MTTSYPAVLPEPRRTSACPPVVRSTGPTDSVVLVALAGPRRRMGPVLRVSLTSAPTTTEAAELVAATAVTVAPHADEVALIFYTDHPEHLDPKTAAKPLMARCPVIDLAVVPNAPHQVPDDLMAATIESGRRVLTSRQDLAQSMEYRPHSGHRPSAFAAFDDSAARDEYIQSAMDRPELLPVLIASAQKTPDDDPRLANLCATLAFLAYHHGDGALAQVAIDRAIRTEPHHRLAHLLLLVMACGIPPQALDRLTW